MKFMLSLLATRLSSSKSFIWLDFLGCGGINCDSIVRRSTFISSGSLKLIRRRKKIQAGQPWVHYCLPKNLIRGIQSCKKLKIDPPANWAAAEPDDLQRWRRRKWALAIFSEHHRTATKANCNTTEHLVQLVCKHLHCASRWICFVLVLLSQSQHCMIKLN